MKFSSSFLGQKRNSSFGFSLVSLAFLTIACGGSSAPPPPSPPVGGEKPPEPVAKPAEKDPDCTNAVAKKHEKLEPICTKECDGGNTKSCLQLGDYLTTSSAPDAGTKALPYFEKACEQGNEEACWKGSEAVKGSDKDHALKLVTKGCHSDMATEYGQQCCFAKEQARASSGKPDDLKSASIAFHKLCRKGHKPSCSERRKTQDAYRKATAPEEFEGTIVSKIGSTVRIKLTGDSPASVGSNAKLLRFFESKKGGSSPLDVFGGLLGGGLRGWVSIASTKITKIDKGIVTVTVLKELSKMKINGRKVNHFSPGARVKLAVPKVSAPLANTASWSIHSIVITGCWFPTQASSHQPGEAGTFRKTRVAR
jgi:hypothetical protein